MSSILIVGAGWSGLSAAVHLSQAGHKVQLFESAPQAGGRARTLATPLNYHRVDNGQHLCIQHYQSLRALLNILNPSLVDQAFHKSPFYWPLPSFKLSLHDTLTVFKLFVFLKWKTASQIDNAFQETTLSVFLKEKKISPSLCHTLFEPLCLSLLNTPPAYASASRFLTLLKSIVSKKSRTLYFPRWPLQDILPTPALSFIKEKGGSIHYSTSVQSLSITQERIQGLHTKTHFIPAEHVIIATPPWIAKKLIPCPSLQKDLGAYQPSIIVTVYLQYPPSLHLHQEYLGLEDPLYHTLWIIDRRLMQQPGLFAIVLTPSQPTLLQESDNISLITHLQKQLAEKLSFPPHALSTKVIREKRGAFLVTPSLPRMPTQPPYKGLWLCGDYCHPLYPATLESAVWSGHHSAQALIHHLSKHKESVSQTHPV
jgi:hydroxysqualene dehydroxylase